MIALPPADRDYLASKGIAFEATEEMGAKPSFSGVGRCQVAGLTRLLRTS